MSKSCWSCGHFLIGAGCYKTPPHGVTVAIDHVCDGWLPEGTKGTVTDFEEMNDGTSWAENEYLQDDESNL